MRALAFVVLLLAAVAPAPVASALTWEPADLRGGEVAGIVFSPVDPDVVFAAYEVNAHALYRSTDGGRTFARVEGPSDHAKVVVADLDTPDAYVALSESVFTTKMDHPANVQSMYHRFLPIDAGAKPILVSGSYAGPSSASFSAVAIAPADHDRMYAAIKGGDGGGPPGSNGGARLFASMDGGVTWTSTSPPVRSITSIAVHPADPRRVWLGTAEGVYETRDAGRTATQLLRSHEVRSLEASADGDQLVMASASEVKRSTDGGRTWQDVRGPLAEVHRVVPTLHDPDDWWAATFRGVFRTTDAGATWRNVSGDLRDLNVQVVAPHPTQAGVAMVGQSGLWSSVRAEGDHRTGLGAAQGLWRTEDGGATWTRSDAGTHERSVEEIATTARPGEAWIGPIASRGGYHTLDAGQHWRQGQTPTLHYPMRIKTSAQDPMLVFVTGWQIGGPLARSTDGGVTWTYTPESVFTRQQGNVHLHGLAVDPTDDRIVYVGSVDDAMSPTQFALTGAHIFKSTDRGATWRASEAGFPTTAPTAVHDIHVAPEDPRVVYASTTAYEAREGRGIWRSEDAGASWTEASAGLTSRDAYAVVSHEDDAFRLVAATGGGLFTSEDGGRSWTQREPVSATDVEARGDVLYAATGRGVLTSADFGATWSAVDGLPMGPVKAIGWDGASVYAGIERGGVYVARGPDVPPVDADSAWAASRSVSGGFPSGGTTGAPPTSGRPSPSGAPDGSDDGERPPDPDGDEPPPQETPLAPWLTLAALAVVMIVRRQRSG